MLKRKLEGKELWESASVLDRILWILGILFVIFGAYAFFFAFAVLVRLHHAGRF